MFRFQALLILFIFLFSVVGRGFHPRAGETPFHGVQILSEIANTTVDENSETDDEYGPMKPFKAKRKAQAPSVQLPVLILTLEQSYGLSWEFLLDSALAPSSVRSAPELRPPIDWA